MIDRVIVCHWFLSQQWNRHHPAMLMCILKTRRKVDAMTSSQPGGWAIFSWVQLNRFILFRGQIGSFTKQSEKSNIKYSIKLMVVAEASGICDEFWYLFILACVVTMAYIQQREGPLCWLQINLRLRTRNQGSGLGLCKTAGERKPIQWLFAVACWFTQWAHVKLLTQRLGR